MMIWRCALAAAALGCAASSAAATTCDARVALVNDWSHAAPFGSLRSAFANTQALNTAISQADQAFAHGARSFLICLPPGKFRLAGAARPGTDAAIDVSSGIRAPDGVAPLAHLINPPPGPDGRLVVPHLTIQGAGWDFPFNPDHPTGTDLYTDDERVAIVGIGTSHITFKDLFLTRPSYTSSQGVVTGTGVQTVTPEGGAAVKAGYVDLAVSPGFPSPLELFSRVVPTGPQSMYLRAYTNDRADPHLVQSTPAFNNAQVPWGRAGGTLVPPEQHGADWRIFVNDPVAPPYRRGDFVCIKSKRIHSYVFLFTGTLQPMRGPRPRLDAGTDITFDHVHFQQEFYGRIVRGVSHVTLSYVAMDRAPPIQGQAPCLSTPSGGPQFGQPADPPGYSTGHVIDHFSAVATGDDSLAFAQASATVSNSEIRDSFARGIFLDVGSDAVTDCTSGAACTGADVDRLQTSGAAGANTLIRNRLCWRREVGGVRRRSCVMPAY